MAFGVHVPVKSGIHFGKIGIRNGYVFETSMARPRPKSGQVAPRGARGPLRSFRPLFSHFATMKFCKVEFTDTSSALETVRKITKML